MNRYNSPLNKQTTQSRTGTEDTLHSMRVDELRSDLKHTRNSTRLEEAENGKSNHDMTTARISVSSNDSDTENVDDNSANNQPTIVLLS